GRALLKQKKDRGADGIGGHAPILEHGLQAENIFVEASCALQVFHIQRRLQHRSQWWRRGCGLIHVILAGYLCSGLPLRLVSARSCSSRSLMDLYISRDAPLSSLTLVSPRLAERAAPAAFC